MTHGEHTSSTLPWGKITFLWTGCHGGFVSGTFFDIVTFRRCVDLDKRPAPSGEMKKWIELTGGQPTKFIVSKRARGSVNWANAIFSVRAAEFIEKYRAAHWPEDCRPSKGKRTNSPFCSSSWKIQNRRFKYRQMSAVHIGRSATWRADSTCT